MKNLLLAQVQREKHKRRRTKPELKEIRETTTATGTQTELTVNEVESLINSETLPIKEVEKLQQRCAQLELDNTRLRAEDEKLSEKITELNEGF